MNVDRSRTTHQPPPATLTLRIIIDDRPRLSRKLELRLLNRKKRPPVFSALKIQATPKVPQDASLSWDCHALARNPERGRRRKGLAMLRVYRHQDNRLVPTELAVSEQSSPADVSGGLWIDLINPTKKEDQFTETVLGV